MTGILTPLDTIAWSSLRNIHTKIFFTWQARQVRKGSHKVLQIDATLESMNDYYRMGGLI